MRRFMTTLVTAAALLVTAGPMMAQDAPVTEERTQPDADSHAPHDGLTIHGTVEEFDGEQLTLRTETGVQHIQIMPETAFPGDLEPGTQVAVDYNRTTQGVMIADQIRLDTGEAGVDVGMEPATTTARVETQERDVDLEADTEADLVATTEPETTRDFETDVATDTEADLVATDTTRDFDTDDEFTTADELPSTGSDLPLIALLGLIGLAGAGALHVLRS